MLKTIFHLFSILVQTKAGGSTSACKSEITNFQWGLIDALGSHWSSQSPCHPHMKDRLREQGSILAPAKEGIQEILLWRRSSVGELHQSTLLSDRKLRPAAATMSQQQQAPQTQACEWIAPQQRRWTAKHSFHSVPPHATLPCGLLVFKTFNLLQDIETGL